MLLFSLAFLLGDLYLQTFSQLPSLLFIFIIMMNSFLLAIFLRKYFSSIYLFFAFSLGFCFTAYYAHQILSWSLPKNIEGQPVTITGCVASLPVNDQWQTRFLFALEKINNQNNKTFIKIAWRHPLQKIKVGDKWQLQVKLKRIHSTQNPGAFDYEAFNFQRGVRASGYVMMNAENKLLTHHVYRYPIEQLRQWVQDKLKIDLPHSQTAIWLQALLIGERSGVSAHDWQVLRNTGTNHLMAIAGLHIGMLAGFIHVLTNFIWRRLPYLPLIFPAQLASAVAALVAAILYSALAGFAIPTERACMMLGIFSLAMLSRKKINSWLGWSYALIIILLINPLTVLTESFWLSFATLALIIFAMSGRVAPNNFWWQWGRVQYVIGLGLMPLTLFLFQSASLIAFFANTVAVPWLTFFILPLCFLSMIFLFFSPFITIFLLKIADQFMAILWIFLNKISQFYDVIWQQVLPVHLFIFFNLACLLLLLPRQFPGKYFSIIFCLPLVFYQPARPQFGEIWLTLLDVGQGLSAIVQTKNHILIYDAGPKLNDNFDMGESVVLPYLHTLSAKKIDMLVISHGDNDHIGGAFAILNAMSVKNILTSVPEKFPSSMTKLCLSGMHWQWDNVQFNFLYPDQANLQLGNNSSCVLRIDNGEQSILLTGDIEKYAENILLQNHIKQLHATILIAPHHGSKTSGIKDFIQAVHPQYVLYATGYRNRYHFPHTTIMNAYQPIAAYQLNTAETGAMEFKLKKHQPIQLDLYRKNSKYYWDTV